MSLEVSPGDRVYVDDRELAIRTPLSRVTYQQLRQRGEGPRFYKIGRRCLYKWSEVQSWIESGATAKAGAL